MRNFRFRLQSLFNVRRQQEEQAQQDLMQQQQVVSALEAEREGLWRAIKAQRGRLVFPTDTELDVEQVQTDRRRLEVLEAQLEGKNGQIEQARQILDRLRQNLVERTREREMVERIREKDHAQWQKEVARLEQSVLDEVSSIAFNRQRRESGQVRTYVLTTVMMVLVIILIYLTGTVGGRQWSERMRKNLTTISFSRKEKTVKVVGISAGGAASATAEADFVLEEEKRADSIESVRRERQRLALWAEELQQKEQRVKMELIALAELKDDIAELRNQVDLEREKLATVQQQNDSRKTREKEERLAKLAKLYSATKPKSAAQLLMDMDPETTAEIIRRMREKEVVKIIEEMQKLGSTEGGLSGAERARDLLDLMAEKAMKPQ